ncbi:Retrovirus-related Pol polyprotein from transposon 412 [Anthophora retusa]
MDLEKDYYDDYIAWKENITPSPITQKPNRPDFLQIVKLDLGEFNERTWVNKLSKHFIQCKKKQLSIGINDLEITNLEKVHVQLMLRFLSTQFPQIKLIFGADPPIDYSLEEKETILRENHNEIVGHLGINRTLKRIQENHNWTGLEKDVTEFIGNCETCQREKLVRIRQKEDAVITDTPLEPNTKIAMDIFGPLSKTKRGNQFILSIQDMLTKYLILIPIKDQQANSIINELLDHYVYIFSAPRQILTDQGTNFVCKLMETFEQAFKIKHVKTTSFHPQSNGSLERTHSTVKDLIRTCTNDRQNEWDENLKLVCMGYNTSVHETTGYTPFELTFGHKANMPSTISATPSITREQLFKLWKKRHDTYIQKAIEITEKNKKRYQRDQNRKIIKTQTIFNIGDRVWIHNDHKQNKLDHEWKTTFTIFVACIPMIFCNLKLTPLEKANIFLEQIDTCYLYNEQISISIVIDTEEILIQSKIIVETIETLTQKCKGDCMYLAEIQNLRTKYRLIYNLGKQLELLLHTRQKRGLLNIIGSVSKSLFGTLDEEDLTVINQNIDQLFDSNNEMKTIVTNQSALIRQIISNPQLESIQLLRNKILKIADSISRNEIITSLIIHTEASLSELHIQLDELFNTIILGKQGIISPQVIKPQQFLSAIGNITNKNMIRSHIEPTLDNFQILLDISSLKLWTQEKKIIYTIIIPMLEDTEWKITKLYPIPHKQSNVFLAPVIDHEYLIITNEQYIPIDAMFLDTYCKKTALLYICKRNQPSHNRMGNSDCQLELINNNPKAQSCQFSLFKIKELTFIPLKTPNMYIAIPSNPITIEALCKRHSLYEINVPSILSSNDTCVITYNNNLMKISGTNKQISYETKYKTFNFSYTVDELFILSDKLDHVPKVSTNFNQYRTTLNQIDNQINQLQFEHRIKIAKEYTISMLQIIGYITTGLLGIYILHKCKLFKIIGKCIPTNLAINICCPIIKNKQETRIPSAMPMVSAPYKENIHDNLSATATIEDISITQIDPARKMVRFARPKRS